MSHLSIQILSSLLNSLPEVAAERCFVPWPTWTVLCTGNPKKGEKVRRRIVPDLKGWCVGKISFTLASKVGTPRMGRYQQGEPFGGASVPYKTGIRSVIDLS
jgi:hypothetical protein